jgi:hypothetical protein
VGVGDDDEMSIVLAAPSSQRARVADPAPPATAPGASATLSAATAAARSRGSRPIGLGEVIAAARATRARVREGAPGRPSSPLNLMVNEIR